MSTDQPRLIQAYLDYLKQLPDGVPRWSFEQYRQALLRSGGGDRRLFIQALYAPYLGPGPDPGHRPPKKPAPVPQPHPHLRAVGSRTS